MNDDKRLFSFVALGLFLGALLLPFFIAMFARDELALGFAAVASSLALLFGVLSWSERISRVVTVSLGALLCVAAAVFVHLTIPKPWEVEQAKAEQERRIAEADRAHHDAILRAAEARKQLK